MAAPIQKLFQSAYKLFSRVTVGSSGFNEHLREVTALASKLTATDLNFNFQDDPTTQRRVEQGEEAPAVYVHLFEDRVLSMGIFVVRQGCRIPLHNHPGMHGVCKVIQGTIRVNSFSEVSRVGLDIPKNIEQDMKQSIFPILKKKEQSQFSPVMTYSSETLTTDDPACVLLPSDGNIHEMISVDGPAAFVDILAPPYDHTTGERVCQYYRDCSEDTPTSSNSQVRWLRSIPPPHSFWCDTMEYNGPSMEIQ
ncbi:2-aminoethanethiol dioxygenase-like [Mizuhopecten yessoensis]|uniref:2-aminoethanethiol dioxygenase n=1 Tax=Mizuhopecten yessoensis TaxID=6573 RepID=A0A210R2D0_MIZYE|nr:2-aminoethanethiol dioxygenase-like [Mizuhopecten yessoensis]OWF55065.1 2-aminoethanethiol dioxygenase [Mizuhopecten yessoensis]